MTLKEIIDLDEILIYAQPIVSLNKASQMIHFEILSRFKDHQGSLVFPDQVFDKTRTAEELKALDLLIFDKAFAALNNLKDCLGQDYIAAINVSEFSIEDDYFLEKIISLGERYHIKPANIHLELTEKGDNGISRFVVDALNLGFNIAIDDFGSENFTISKLRYKVLRVVDPRCLDRISVKIDRGFILNILDETIKDNAIDKAFINMALTVVQTYPGVSLVAEGIENKEVLSYIQDKGFSHGQGYYWSRPVPLTKDYIQPG